MKKIISIFIVMVLIALLSMPYCSAATAPAAYIGDVNEDGDIDILDATIIQRVIAEIDEKTTYIRYVGDTNKDGNLSVIDATKIQRRVAEIDKVFGMDFFNYDLMIHDFYSDYESGAAMVGVPVTFTMNSRAGSPILAYELYVDDKLVATSETDSSLTYTFEKAGEYKVVMQTVAMFATQDKTIDDFIVIEPSDDMPLQFKNLYSTGKYWGRYIYGEENVQINAEGTGGTAPYQYMFDLKTYINGSQSVNMSIHQSYSENNTFLLPSYSEYDYRNPVECELKISIKDADNNVVERTQYIIYQMMPIG